MLVERHGLKPPVNIEQVLREYSDVEQHEWTQDCDGFAIFGGNQSRPRVYIKANVPARRKRFTFAHELGHIVCYWHTGKKCASIPNPGGAALGTEEAEANSFASHILLPDSFLAQFQDQYLPAPEILDAVAQADVSASAGILALRRVLLPGYVFLVPGLDHAVVSTGTYVPPGAEDYSQLAKFSGRHPHQGSLIRWYQLSVTEPLPATLQTSVTTTEMLRRALTAARPEENVSSLMKQINGVVGGTLTRTRATVSAETIFAALEQRFRNNPLYEDLMATDEFRRYLRQKSVDVAQKRVSRS
nr:ImmA/IrrE family metallo-endopeptidase [Sphaerisporangium rubeum]